MAYDAVAQDPVPAVASGVPLPLRQPFGRVLPCPLVREHTYEWLLENMTQEFCQMMPPGGALFSPTFCDRGLGWQLELYLNGFPNQANGHVQLKVCLRSPNETVVVGVRVTVGKRLPEASERTFSTCPQCSPGGTEVATYGL